MTSVSGTTGPDGLVTKKIAQLTKVIIALNSRLEDFEQEKASVVERYESEIETIVKDGKTKLEAMKVKLQESIPLAQHTRTIDEIKAKFTSKLAGIESDWGQFKATIAEERSELDARNTAHEQQLENMRAKVMQMTDAVRTSNVAHQQMLLRVENEKADLEDKLHLLTLESQDVSMRQQEQAAREAAFKREGVELRRQMEVLRDGHQEQMDYAKEQHAAAIQQLQADHEQRVEALQSDHANELAVVKNEVVVLTTQLNETRAQLSEESTAQGQHINDVVKELDETKAQLAKMTEEKTALSSTAKSTASELFEKSKALTRAEQDLVAAKKELEEKKAAIADLDEYSKMQESSLEANAGELLRLQSLVKSLQAKESSQSKSAHKMDETLQQLQNEVAEAQAKTKQVEEMWQQKHKTAITKLEGEHQSALGEMKKKLGDRLDEKEAALLAETEKAEATQARAIQVESDLRTQLNRATTELEKLVQKTRLLEEENEARADTESKLYTEREHLTALKEKNRLLTVKFQTTEAAAEKLEARVEQLVADLAEARNMHQAELEELRKSHDSALQKLRADLLEHHNAQMQSQLDERTKQFSTEKRFMTEEHDKEVASLKHHLEIVMVECNTLRESSRATSSDLGAQLATLKTAHLAELATLRQDYESKLARLREQGEAKAAELKASLEKNFSQQLAALRKQHELERTQADQVHQDLANKLTSGAAAEVEKALEAAKEKSDKDLKAMQTKLEAKFAKAFERKENALKTKHEEEVSKLKQEFEHNLEIAKSEIGVLSSNFRKTKAILERKTTDIGYAEEQLETLRQELVEAKQALEDKLQELLQIRRESIEEMERREGDMTRAHERQIKDVVEKYRNQFARAGQQSTQIQAELRERIIAAEARAAQLQQEFDTRPSKEEDVARIAALEEALQHAQQQLKEFVAENKRLNLEVVQREHTFNVLFKNHPNVQQPTSSSSSHTTATRAGTNRPQVPSTTVVAAVGGRQLRQHQVVPAPPQEPNTRRGSRARSARSRNGGPSSAALIPS